MSTKAQRDPELAGNQLLYLLPPSKVEIVTPDNTNEFHFICRKIKIHGTGGDIELVPAGAGRYSTDAASVVEHIDDNGELVGEYKQILTAGTTLDPSTEIHAYR